MSPTDAVLAEIRQNLAVLRNEAVETRRILKMLVSVISDTNSTNALLREELTYIRTAREQSERAAVLADRVGITAEPTEEIPASPSLLTR